MDDEWSEAFLTAILWGPPTLLGVLALVRGRAKMGRRVVSRRMTLLAATLWLSPLPLAIAMTIGLLYIRHPGAEEAGRIGREWTPTVLRIMSFLCLVAGGIVAFAGSRPEELPVPKARKVRRRR